MSISAVATMQSTPAAPSSNPQLPSSSTVLPASASSVQAAGMTTNFNINTTTGSDYATAVRTPGSGLDTTTSYEQSRRQVSSVVISEQVLTDLPGPGAVKYVEVPVVEEVVRHVPGKREVIETEKIVPKYEYEWVERTVEVPQIQYIDRHVEVEKIQEVVRHVPVRQVQEVPREVVKKVTRPEYRQIEKIVEVPGEIIERQQRVVVENPVRVKRFNDYNEPVVVAQTICPVVTESNEVIDVDVYEYEPQVIPIDVHVAKPIASHLTAVGATQEIHQYVQVPAAQYNTLLRNMNAHLGNDVDSLPYIQGEGNQIPFLGANEQPGVLPPHANVVIHPQGTVDFNNPYVLTSGQRGIVHSQQLIAGTSSTLQTAQQRTSELYHDQQQRGIVVHSREAAGPAMMQQPPTYPSSSLPPTSMSLQQHSTHQGQQQLQSQPIGGAMVQQRVPKDSSIYSGPMTDKAHSHKVSRPKSRHSTGVYPLPAMTTQHKRRPCEC